MHESTKALSPPDQQPDDRRVDWLGNIPFLSVHAGCLLVLWTGVSPTAAAIGLATLLVRMFGLTGGYHRYFCHRAFKTSRVFQFVLAWLGAAAAQKGPLWWAGHHRSHHRHSDTAADVHPPGVYGFFWAHIGWVMCPANLRTKMELMGDFARYRELTWLDRNHHVAPVSLAVALFLLGAWLESTAPALGVTGLQVLAVGFFLSTTVLYHVTFAVNSIGHTIGHRRFETRDASRNGFLLALLTGGEGWHNNHHRYPASERQGFYWWEIDPTHYVVVLLNALGIVWDVRGPSAEVLAEGRGRRNRAAMTS